MSQYSVFTQSGEWLGIADSSLFGKPVSIGIRSEPPIDEPELIILYVEPDFVVPIAIPICVQEE